MKLKLIIASLVIISLSCKSEIETKDCGEVKTFTVDKEYCQKYGLREETFTVDYPSGVTIETQEDYKSPNYVSFIKYDKDENIEESVNIGFYYGLKQSGGSTGAEMITGLTKESLINKMIGQLKGQGINLENVTMKDEDINNEEHFAARGNFSSQSDDLGFKGNYLMQFVLIATAPDHGVLVIMSAREDSGIKTYKDFETKGCMASVLKSIK